RDPETSRDTPEPLYEATKRGEREPGQQKAFEEIRRALTNAPSLGLPDTSKPCFLYVHERTGVVVGVLTQMLGSWHCPVAYLSKQLDSVAQGWPLCLQALAATALLVSEADKLTMGHTWY
uniref:Reverse transcriptase/retrotransposon-derived protein RNase H-like domain-containing protein n=1 Tax=Sus scrofa TaxID=9823 RepID=A0A8W4F9I5_PIG